MSAGTRALAGAIAQFCLALALFSCMDSIAKHLVARYPAGQIAWARVQRLACQPSKGGRLDLQRGQAQHVGGNHPRSGADRLHARHQIGVERATAAYCQQRAIV